MGNTVTSGKLAQALTKKVISEAFEIARSNRTGILQVVGIGSAVPAFEGYKMGWLDMRVDAASGVLDDATLADSATTINVATGHGSRFRAGMLLSNNKTEEIMLVQSVSGDALTVKRKIGGTAAAELAKGAILYIDSVGRAENSQAENDGIFQPIPMENFFQTMDTAVEMSRRALATMQFGGTNDLKFQVAERIKQLTTQMDRALVGGVKVAETINGEQVTFTGGLRYFMNQAGAIKTDASAADLTLDMINALNAEVVSRGGTSNTIAVGIKQARNLSKLVSANYSSNRLGEWVADEGSLLTLPSDLPLVGNVNKIVVDTNLRDDELIIFDAGMITVRPMASGNATDDGNWTTKDATQNGQDGERARIIGDFSMEIRQSQTHMARLHNLKVS